MKIGYIGLGKMGYNMVLNMLGQGLDVVGYNRTQEKTKKAEEQGVEGAYSIEELMEKMSEATPRIFWIMVTHTAVDDVLSQMKPFLQKGDIVIDGGNTFYKDSIRRAENLKREIIAYLDVGVSGGPECARSGASMMIGGNKEVFESIENLFKEISTKDGYAYMGRSGAGHFVKMVHNGIEYGMMQSIAEGFDILKHSEFDLSLREVMKPYAHGSVIRSALIGWLDKAFEKYGDDLEQITGSASQSGEGKWTAKVAKEMGIADDVIEESIEARIESQKSPNYQGKLISAMRGEFGGHPVLVGQKPNK